MKSIRHNLLIAAPVEKIYAAITTQQGLSAWWTPDTKAEASINSIARFAFGPDYYKEMKVAALKPFDEVKWICITGADEWIDTTISFKLQSGNRDELLQLHPEMQGQMEQLRQDANNALLIFQHDGWKEYTPMFAECNYTWGQFLKSLKLYCETGEGKPWPHQHR